MYTVQCPPFYWKVNGRKNTAHIHQIHNAENIHLGGLLCTFYLYESKTLLLSFLPISYIYTMVYIQCFSWSIFPPNQIHPFFFFIRSLCSSDERRCTERSSYNAIYLNGNREINLCYCRIEASLLNNFCLGLFHVVHTMRLRTS